RPPDRAGGPASDSDQRLLHPDRLRSRGARADLRARGGGDALIRDRRVGCGGRGRPARRPIARHGEARRRRARSRGRRGFGRDADRLGRARVRRGVLGGVHGEARGRGLRTTERLDRIPPYLFAELERKIEQKKAAGIDVISLGIGDPDTPTPGHILRAMAEALHDPSTHRYPTNRGRSEFREAVAEFYLKRFEVSLDPENQVIPAIGGKE